jgi:hypothetical protein
MTVLPTAVTWILSRECADDIRRIRFALGDDYAHNVSQQRQMLCDYFSGDAGCSARGGSSISTLGSACGTGKLLKMRWTLPGSGKSGGLRFAIVAFCDDMKVVLCRAWVRKDDPSSADFDAAGDLAAEYLDNDRGEGDSDP